MIVGASIDELLPKPIHAIVTRELMNVRRPIGPASRARNWYEWLSIENARSGRSYEPTPMFFRVLLFCEYPNRRV